jgi:hypothetical protein
MVGQQIFSTVEVENGGGGAGRRIKTTESERLVVHLVFLFLVS